VRGARPQQIVAFTTGAHSSVMDDAPTRIRTRIQNLKSQKYIK